jgi:hypothetical protein
VPPRLVPPRLVPSVADRLSRPPCWCVEEGGLLWF